MKTIPILVTFVALLTVSLIVTCESFAGSIATDTSIQRISDKHFIVDRSILNRIVSEPGAKASFSHGRGVKVFGFNPKGVYSALGLQNGDTILDINGQGIESSNDRAKLATQIRSGDRVRVRLMRRGKVTSINYLIRN